MVKAFDRHDSEVEGSLPGYFSTTSSALINETSGMFYSSNLVFEPSPIVTILILPLWVQIYMHKVEVRARFLVIL